MFELYEEITITPHQNGVKVSVPWMDGFVKIVSSASNNDSFCRQFSNALKSMNRFNSETLVSFPFCYLIPRKLSANSNPTIISEINPQQYQGPTKLLKAIAEKEEESLDTATEYLSDSWTWNIDDAINRSQTTHERFDPLSAYTFIRRRRHVGMKSSEGYRSRLKLLLKTNETHFFRAVAISLNQGLFVTETCVDCLQPALKGFPESYYEIKTFIKEEEGHSKYIFQSLKEIPHDLKELPLFNETKMAMMLLKYTAKFHPLAFACIVSQLEESGYQPYDPTAELLKESSSPQAAKGIEKHFMINQQGNHAETGGQFVLNLNAIFQSELVAAVRFAELFNQLVSGIENRLYAATK